MFPRSVKVSVSRPWTRPEIAIALLIPLGGAALVFGLSLYFGG